MPVTLSDPAAQPLQVVGQTLEERPARTPCRFLQPVEQCRAVAVALIQWPQPPRSVLPSPRLPVDASHIRAVEFEVVISPIGRLCLPNNQQLKFPTALGGRTATVWADERSIHVFIDVELARTRA